MSAGDDGQLSAAFGHDNEFLVPSLWIIRKRQKPQRLEFAKGFRDCLSGNLHSMSDLRSMGRAAIEISKENEVWLGNRFKSTVAQTFAQLSEYRL